MGHDDDAIADFEMALQVAPAGWPHRASIRARIADRVAGRLFQEGSRLLEQKKYREAIEKFSEIVSAWRRSQQAMPAAYNVACGYSLLGEKSKALEWLEKAVEMGWKDVTHLEKDSDLDSLREETGFKKLLGKLKGE